MQKNTVDKNSPEYLQKQISGARHSLLLIIIFTLINVLMLAADTGRYFLFSASVPYYLTAFCMGMDYGLTGDYFGTFATAALVISAVILVVYLVCWIMSKKKIGWIVAALVLFSLDTLVLLLAAVGFDMLADSILDFVFHAWVIVELVQAINANKKLKALASQSSPEFGTEETYTGPEF